MESSASKDGLEQAIPTTNSSEPRHPKFRIGVASPGCEGSSTGVTDPDQVRDWSGSENPRWRKSSAGMADPRHARLWIGKDRPNCVKSRSSTKLPSRGSIWGCEGLCLRMGWPKAINQIVPKGSERTIRNNTISSSKSGCNDAVVFLSVLFRVEKHYCTFFERLQSTLGVVCLLLLITQAACALLCHQFWSKCLQYLKHWVCLKKESSATQTACICKQASSKVSIGLSLTMVGYPAISNRPWESASCSCMPVYVATNGRHQV